MNVDPSANALDIHAISAVPRKIVAMETAPSVGPANSDSGSVYIRHRGRVPVSRKSELQCPEITLFIQTQLRCFGSRYVHNLEARNKELEQQIAANGPNGLAM